MPGFSQWRMLANAENFAGDSAGISTPVFDPALLLKVYLRIVGYSNAAAVGRLRFNGDTGNNYGFSVAENFAASTTGVSTGGVGVATGANTNQAMVEVTVFNLATIIKSMIWQGVAGSSLISVAPRILLGSGLWNNAAAITSIQLDPGSVGGNVLAGSGIAVFGADLG
jgi:hypothetical protein